MNEKMHALKIQYRSFVGGDLKGLYQHYLKRKEAALLDSIASATAVGTIFLSDQINYDAITPAMEKAFYLSFPGKELTDLENYSTQELRGVISNWKGKTFEVEVAEKLNNGELVGDLQLEPGQYVELAEVSNQPGWDLQIFNEDGSVAEALQLKATSSLSYIKEAFEKYPDIDILATEEVSHLNPEIINSGISNEELTTQMEEPLQNVLDSPLEDFAEMAVPGLPLMMITLSEGRKVFVGKQSMEIGFRNFVDRGVTSGLAMGSVYAVSNIVGSGVGIPAAFIINYGIRRFRDRQKSEQTLDKYIGSVEHLDEIYS